MHLLALSVSRILKEVKLPKQAKINQDSHWSPQTHTFPSARQLVRTSGQSGEVRHGKTGLPTSVLAHQLASARTFLGIRLTPPVVTLGPAYFAAGKRD